MAIYISSLSYQAHMTENLDAKERVVLVIASTCMLTLETGIF